MRNKMAEQLLSDWEKLEKAAGKFFGTGSEDAVSLLRGEARFAEYWEQLEYCRRVCALLCRSERINGDYALYPSDAMLQLLETVLRKLEHPETTLDIMTPVNSLLVADEDSNVLAMMRSMRERKLSHVPLLEHRRVASVFSVETIFQATLDRQLHVTDKTVMRDLDAYLPFEKHLNHAYRFVEGTADLRAVQAFFDEGYTREGKLKLLLVTEDGRADSPLLGVVTPYDIRCRAGGMLQK
jgi:hypothetical protein